MPLRSRAAAIALTVAAALGAAGCGDADEERITGADPFDDAGSEGALGVGADSSPAEELVLADGQVLALAGTVAEVVEPGTFTLDDPNDDDPPVLVLLTDGVPVPTDAQAIVVTGIAHAALDLPVAEVTVERDLDDSAYQQLEGQPYLEGVDVAVDGGPADY